MKNKKLGFIVIVLFLLGGFCVFLFSPNLRNYSRRPASEPTRDRSSTQKNLEQSRIQKTEMIKNIQWSIQSKTVELRITSQEAGFCEDWTDIEVQIQAEGIAISGQPPELHLKAPCFQNEFKITMERQPQNWADSVVARDFLKLDARDFFVANIKISGPKGVMNISPSEVNFVLGQSLDFSN